MSIPSLCWFVSRHLAEENSHTCLAPYAATMSSSTCIYAMQNRARTLVMLVSVTKCCHCRVRHCVNRRPSCSCHRHRACYLSETDQIVGITDYLPSRIAWTSSIWTDSSDLPSPVTVGPLLLTWIQHEPWFHFRLSHRLSPGCPE